MKSAWDDNTADDYIERYAVLGVEENMALRVYSSRLLGRNPSLVLHGGGNTSYKTDARDIAGDVQRVLCIKGSGWDLDSIEPAGLPAVKLQPLIDIRSREVLSDEHMVALQRLSLLDPMAPNPSIETLLHAFLPFRFVDHTHSTAILALVDQANSLEICAQVFGESMGFVPYVMPGFELAQRAASVFDDNPDVEGLILDKHGIITFGDDARQSYERMIEKVSLAENRINQNSKRVFVPRVFSGPLAAANDIAPLIRGAVANADSDGDASHQIMAFRQSEQILEFVNGQALKDYASRGVSTPDLAIRIKNQALILPPAELDLLHQYGAYVKSAVAAYVKEYQAYFSRCNSRDDVERQILDPMPRLVLVPGIGLFGLGRSAREASVCADIAEVWIEAVTGAERVGEFRPASEAELFELEYWSLEQAKLAGKSLRSMAGQVAIVTGGAGAIGSATAECFASNGAHVVIADRDYPAARLIAEKIGEAAVACRCDVTETSDVDEMFAAAVAAFGGVDVLVSNAGSAVEGEISSLSEAQLRDSFELNFFAHQRVAQHAVRIMRSQETGGVLLFNASKQAVNPGENFGAYGTAKAATLLLSRQYALECGRYGIRSNAVNADRIRSGLLDDTMISRRAESRAISETQYMRGNLLGREVRAADVAQAFLHLALAERTTAGVSTVDGGNIAAALR